MSAQPPVLPPAAWYDDPERPGQLRYWDGVQWTDHRAPHPDAAVATGRLSDVGKWLEGMFRHLWARRVPISIITVISIVVWAITVATIGWSVDGIVYVQGDGWTGIDGGRITIAVISVAFNIFASVVLYMAAAHQVFWSRLGEIPTAGESCVAALKGVPRLIGWSSAMVFAFVAVLIVIVVAAALSGPVGLVLVLAAIPLGVWVSVKTAFLIIAAVVPVPGMSTPAASAAVSADRRFWPVLGRLIVVSIAAAVVSFGLSLPFSALSGGGDDIENAFVIDDDVIERVDVGALADAAGYEFSLVAVLSSIPQTISPLIVMAGLATLFAEIHGRPRRGIES